MTLTLEQKLNHDAKSTVKTRVRHFESVVLQRERLITRGKLPILPEVNVPASSLSGQTV